MSRLFLFLILVILSSSLLYAQPRNPYQNPSNDPAHNQYLNVAAQLAAEQVKQLYGGNIWHDSMYVAFDFVGYTKADEELTRFRLTWNMATDQASISSTFPDGRQWIATFSSLSKRNGTMVIDSTAVPEPQLGSALNVAYDHFVHNSRWLLLPLQLLKPNVHVRKGIDTLIFGTPLSELVVTFSPEEGVRNSKFSLYVDEEYHNIEGWGVSIEGSPPKNYVWRSYTREGPFLVSTKRWATDQQSYIRLENITMRSLKQKDQEVAATQE